MNEVLLRRAGFSPQAAREYEEWGRDIDEDPTKMVCEICEREIKTRKERIKERIRNYLEAKDLE